MAEDAPSIELPKNTLVALAGQNAWHICTGVAPPRVEIGKYLPSQLRTQNAGPEPAVATGFGGAGCWLRPNGSAKKLACARGLALLLLLRAEKEVEQAFGGRHARPERDRPRDHHGNKHHAAPHALNTQLFTQRELHPNATRAAANSASAGIHHKRGW